MKKIELHGKYGTGKFALVDDEDYELVNKYRWTLHSRGYITVNINKNRVYMHRIIMNPKTGDVVDHINHDKLDNRKCNLRICTQSQNIMNSRKHKTGASEYKGVCFYKGKWTARIVQLRKTFYLGYFPTEAQAAHAYNLKATELFGEFAFLNEIN